MRTVFHVSTVDQLSYVDAKVTNFLADGAVDVRAVAVVVDDPAVIDAAAGDGRERVEAVLDAGTDETETAFCVCSNALRGATATMDDLPACVEAASSGVGELTPLQYDGWADIRP
jgi:intracellular sulfur oxidation DsrE/DsrF family protein